MGRALWPSMLASLLWLPIAGTVAAFWDPVTAQCQGEAIGGSGRAIDGDTLELSPEGGGSAVIRLIGVDAPELFQECRDPEGPWPCGQEARATLDALLAGRVLACTPCGREGGGATVAICRDGDTDIGVELLAAGMATSHAFFSNAMHSAELRARAAGRGLWRGDWVHPQAWRDGARLGEGPCSGCLVPR